MWSLGVSLYHMLTGQLPFLENDRMALFKKIEQGNYDFPPELWNGISDLAKDLVKKTLDVNPNTRITAEQALKHPWITKPKTSPTTALQISQLQNTVSRKRTSEMVLCSSDISTKSTEGSEQRKRLKQNVRGGSTSTVL